MKLNHPHAELIGFCINFKRVRNDFVEVKSYQSHFACILDYLFPCFAINWIDVVETETFLAKDKPKVTKMYHK